MIGDSYIVDLHVHTPASRDYRGTKTEDEYIKILESARENKVNLICIADHFSVTGYSKFMTFKEEKFYLLQSLRKRHDVNSVLLTKVQEEFDLLNSIHILMGIEIKISPGIHYIIVFKENINPNQVEEFLDLKSNGDFKHLKGSEDYMFNVNTREFFAWVEEFFPESFFIYAPHCDSQSGLIEGLKSFKTERLNILKDKRLVCMGFNKEGSREYLKEDLLPQISKDRDIPLGLIQDSDYHGDTGEKVGSYHFLIERSEKLNFTTVFNKLIAGEDITTTVDTARQRYEDFISGKKVFKIGIVSNIEDINADKLCNEACAALNSNKGLFEFQVKIQGEQQSQKIKEIIEHIVQNILKKIDFMPGKVAYSEFPMSQAKPTIVMNLGMSDRLHLYNGLCYILDAQGDVIVATASDIESIVARKIHQRFGKINDAIADEITTKTHKIKNCLLDFSIAYKVDSKLHPFKSIKKIGLPLRKISEEITDTTSQSNGSANGDLGILDQEFVKEINGGRYPQAYLRLTLPTYDSLEVIEDIIFNELEENSILVTVMGGCFLATKTIKLLNNIPCYKIALDDSEFPPQLMASWLRSSFLQWYISKVYDYENIFDFIYRNRIPFINEICKEHKDSIVYYTNDIIKNEIHLLKKVNDKKNDVEVNELVESHNRTCDDLMRKIDNIFFSCLKLETNEMFTIYQDLKGLNVYDFNSLG